MKSKLNSINKKIRILNINPGLNYCGGIESYSMNYYRYIDKNKYTVDFAAHDIIKDANYKDEIESNGNKVFIFSKFTIKNFKKIMKELNLFFKNNKYDIIHCNMFNASPFYFYYAKKYGVKVRILHMHQTKYASKFYKKFRNMILLKLGKIFATDFAACSKDASEFLEKKKNVTILHNAIDITRFSYSRSTRNEIRKKLNVQNDFLIGHVGRFSIEKNHLFLLEIFNEFHKLNKNSKLLLIGSGDEEENIKNKVKKLNLQNYVIFLGNQERPEDYYQAMDLFLFPSIFEGLGMAAIEAEVSGLPVICSKNLSNELKVTDNLYKISLNESIHTWTKKIEKLSKIKRKDRTKEFIDSSFNIENEVSKLEKFYDSLIERNKNE